MVEFGQMAAVVGVLTLLGLTLWFLRRRGFAGRLPLKVKTARRLECLERLPLGPQHTLHLIRLGDTSLLVASSPSGCSLVQSFPDSAGRLPEAAR
ncbi:MAG TPA: flagellar biosynthetic protein FliO [Bryobacteraceae bacterium]|jgi:flagellar biogenesis protein FliO|nr:flagellar biosynthetic protein FliO [Bryobacteraceae bacterium]